jgi:Acetyltransferase (GNAT) family
LPRERSRPDSIAPGARAWTVGSALSRAAEVARSEGLRSLWFKVLGETVHRRLLLLEASIDDLPPAAPGEGSFEFSFLSLGEIGEGVADMTREESARRLRRGDRCFCTRRDGRLVAVSWIAFEEASVEYLDCRLLLAPGVAYLYDVYTAPDARGGGIFRVSWFALARALGVEGVHTILTAVLPENRSARRAFGKLPYRVVGTFGYAKLGSWRRRFLRGRTRAATIA